MQKLLQRFSNRFPVQSALYVPWYCCDAYRCVSTTNTLHSIKSERNHYEVLDVKRSASAVEIREAFLKLSKELHPDINSDDPENHQKFVLLNEAYSVLSKSLSRRDYDLTLQMEKYLRQHQSYSAYRSYGYQTDRPHYHYRDHVSWDGGTSSDSHEHKFQHGKRFRLMVNYYSLTAFFTIGLVTFILMSKELIVPEVRKKSVQQSDVVAKHDFIMTSQHEGRTVFYYAVPDTDNPELFKVLTVSKKQSDEKSNDNCEVEALNLVNHGSAD